MGRSISGDAAASQTKTVFSVDGFQKGDLIYKTASKIGKIPDNFVSTASFEASQREIKYYRGETSLYSRKTITSQSPTSQTSMGVGVAAAVLSNGNVVSVYHRSYNNPGTGGTYLDVVFQIDQPDGTSVVAPTVVNPANTTYRSYENRCLSVAADSSGGFAVVWMSATSFQGNVQLFDNSGSTVGSLRGFTNSAAMLKVKSFNNGTYALVYCSSTNICYFRTVSSSALGTEYTVSSNITFSGNFDVAVDSSNVAHIVYSQSNMFYRQARDSSSNLTIGDTIDNSPGPMNGAVVREVGVAISASGKIIAMALGSNGADSLVVYGKDGVGSGGWPAKVSVTWDSSNSSEPYSNFYVENIPSTDNFFYHASGSEYLSSQVIDYLGAAQGPVINNFGARQSSGARGLILANSELRFYVSGQGKLSNEYRTDGIPLSEVGYVTIDQTNYTGSGENVSANEVVLASTTASVNGYARSGSTPRTAQFTAAADSTSIGTLPITTGESTFVNTIVSLGESNDIHYIRGVELDNGNIAIVYATLVKHVLLVIDKDYNEISRTDLQTSASTSMSYAVALDITKLANGNIVVVSTQSGTRIPTARLYDATMSEITSETVLDVSPTSVNATEHNFCVTQIPYQPTYFLFSFRGATGYQYFGIYDSTDMSQTLSSGCFNVDTYQIQKTQYMIVDKRGIFYSIYQNSTQSDFSVWRGADNSFPNCTSVGSFSRILGVGNNSYGRYNSKIIMFADGTISFPFTNGSGTEQSVVINGTSNSDWNQSASAIAATNDQGAAQGTTGNGQYFFVHTGGGTYSGSLWVGRTTQSLDPQRVTNGVYNSPSASAAYRAGWVIPSGGDTAHLIFRRGTDPSHSIGKLRIRPTQYVLKTVQNVTLSAPVALNEKTSPLLGVAASDCAAGGSGIVQVSGSTVLNTNYPSGTSEFFDFRSQFSDGVNGLISGRNIDLGD